MAEISKGKAVVHILLGRILIPLSLLAGRSSNCAVESRYIIMYASSSGANAYSLHCLSKRLSPILANFYSI